MTAPVAGIASATYHEVRFTYDPARAAVWRAICRYVQPFVTEQEGLLELGAGYGDFSRSIRANPKWALDINAELASHWSRDVRPLIQSALDPLPLASASVATVLASNFFEHFAMAECRTVLAEVRRVLKPGGRLVAVQPNFRLEPRRYFDDYTHVTPFTDGGFTDFLRSLGWRIVHREGRFLPFSMKSRLPKSGWLVKLYLALPYRPLAGQFLVVAEIPG
ncbi:MAG TPA: class I SAM-dependent methyltransferase [Bryobacterales bacterium]|nr:class I SAM-dependent methyltransferase [Bryobacterales bacterium]